MSATYDIKMPRIRGGLKIIPSKQQQQDENEYVLLLLLDVDSN